MDNVFSDDADWSLGQIYYPQGLSRLSELVLSILWFSVAIIHDYMDSTIPEISLSISQEEIL